MILKKCFEVATGVWTTFFKKNFRFPVRIFFLCTARNTLVTPRSTHAACYPRACFNNFLRQWQFQGGEGTLLWAISFFLNENKINIFNLMHIGLFLTEKKIHIFYCFSWKVTFSMSKVNFWIFGFIERKSKHRFIYERKLK